MVPDEDTMPPLAREHARTVPARVANHPLGGDVEVGRLQQVQQRVYAAELVLFALTTPPVLSGTRRRR